MLTAGEGTRLRPLTENKSKALVEVTEKPIVTYCLEQLVDLGADEFYVVVGYLRERLISHCDDEFAGASITPTVINAIRLGSRIRS